MKQHEYEGSATLLKCLQHRNAVPYESSTCFWKTVRQVVWMRQSRMKKGPTKRIVKIRDRHSVLCTSDETEWESNGGEKREGRERLAARLTPYLLATWPSGNVSAYEKG